MHREEREGQAAETTLPSLGLQDGSSDRREALTVKLKAPTGA